MTKWQIIRVPEPLFSKLKELSEKEGIAYHHIISRLLEKQEPKVDEKQLDRVAWYIVKLSMSIGRLKEMPVDANLAKTLKTIMQIEERLSVDLQGLKEEVKKLPELMDTQVIIKVNELLKEAIKQMIVKGVLGRNEG